MKDTKIVDNDISLVLTGPSAYSVTWKASFVDNKLIINFDSSPTIIGGEGEIVSLKLANVKAFQNLYNIPITTPYGFTFDASKPASSANIQSASNGASYTFLFTALISIGIGILTGGSMELMWSLANTLQIIYFFGMMDLYYSADLQTVFDFMAYCNFEYPFQKKFEDFINKLVDIDQIPVNNKFDNTGFAGTNIIANSIDKIGVIVLMFGAAAGVAILIKKYKNKDNKCTRFLKKVDFSIRYSTITRFIIEIMLNMSISSLITISYGSTNAPLEYLSYSISLAVMGVFLLTLLYVTVFPAIYFEEIVGYPDLNLRHGLLFLDFKRSHVKCMLYYSYFIIRRLSLGFIYV
jgi:hypothetical protein